MQVGGPAAIHALCRGFYRKAFRDATLAQFIAEADEEMHGGRLANWIVEKMGGHGKVRGRRGAFKSSVWVWHSLCCIGYVT